MAGRRKGSNALTPLELKIMQVLWSEGPSNVQQVQKGLSSSDDLAYNTVQTMLNILYRKGRVDRTLNGRAYTYRTITSKEKVLGLAARDLVERMFGGSTEELVMSLIKNRQVDLKTIEELRRKLAAEQGRKDDE
jgi:predicted transcriptional regulator